MPWRKAHGFNHGNESESSGRVLKGRWQTPRNVFRFLSNRLRRRHPFRMHFIDLTPAPELRSWALRQRPFRSHEKCTLTCISHGIAGSPSSGAESTTQKSPWFQPWEPVACSSCVLKGRRNRYRAEKPSCHGNHRFRHPFRMLFVANTRSRG